MDRRMLRLEQEKDGHHYVFFYNPIDEKELIKVFLLLEKREKCNFDRGVTSKLIDQIEDHKMAQTAKPSR